MAESVAADALDPQALVRKLLAMTTSGWMSQAVSVAAELNIADLLSQGARTSEECAREIGAHPASLYRLMRALATFEILQERADGGFELTPMGAFLISDAPLSVRSWAILCGRHLMHGWAGLLDSVKTGEGVRGLSGHDLYKELQQDPLEAAVFNQAMVEVTRLIADGVAQDYDFSGMKRVVDVGGGYGQLLAVILKVNPLVRGVVFDLPHAMERGRRYFEEIGLEDRCDFLSGSFFDSVPAGGDAYMLKSVLHNWNDERAAVILKRCGQAMGGRGKLILVERMVPARLEPSPNHRALALIDLNMLVMLGARERTEDEFRVLLHAAGFEVTRIIATVLSFTIIEAASRSHT
jgi:orsellinic acid C2-O-methyltransferase